MNQAEDESTAARSRRISSRVSSERMLERNRAGAQDFTDHKTAKLNGGCGLIKRSHSYQHAYAAGPVERIADNISNSIQYPSLNL